MADRNSSWFFKGLSQKQRFCWSPRFPAHKGRAPSLWAPSASLPHLWLCTSSTAAQLSAPQKHKSSLGASSGSCCHTQQLSAATWTVPDPQKATKWLKILVLPLKTLFPRGWGPCASVKAGPQNSWAPSQLRVKEKGQDIGNFEGTQMPQSLPRLHPQLHSLIIRRQGCGFWEPEANG